MAEYITKEAAIEVFEWGDADVIENYGDGCDFGFSRGAIKSAINSIPTADVAPVVHGRIVGSLEDGRYRRRFSCCGEDATMITQWAWPKYCPNCGAKMDGEP